MKGPQLGSLRPPGERGDEATCYREGDAVAVTPGRTDHPGCPWHPDPDAVGPSPAP